MRADTSNKILSGIIFFIAACALSVLNSVSGTLTFYGIAQFSWTAVLYYLVFANCIETEKELRSIERYLLICLVFQGGLGVLQYATGQSVNVFKTGHGESGLLALSGDANVYRASGTTPHPNGFASLIAPLLLLNILVYQENTENRRLRLIGMVLGFLSLLFSFSRGGWLGFIVAIIIFLFMRNNHNVRKPGGIIGLVIIASIVICSFLPVLYERLLKDDMNAAMSRIPLMKLAFNMIKEHPIIGVGLNTFSNVKRKYTTPDLEGLYSDQVHNQYLLVFAETGIIGLAGFLWIIICMFKESSSCIRQNRSNVIKYMAFGIRLGLIASVIHMNVNMFNSRLQLGLLFMLGGLLTAGNKLIRRSDDFSANPPERHAL